MVALDPGSAAVGPGSAAVGPGSAAVGATAASLPDAATRLLAESRRRLMRVRVTRSMRVASWSCAAAAGAAVPVHFLYRALDPAVLGILLGALVAGSAVHACARRPSLAEAAAYLDQKLGGRCAYRTLLELGPAALTARTSAVARTAFLEWVQSDAARAEPVFRAQPPVPWPLASLASAAVAVIVALGVLQLPGASLLGSEARVAGEPVASAHVPGLFPSASSRSSSTLSPPRDVPPSEASRQASESEGEREGTGTRRMASAESTSAGPQADATPGENPGESAGAAAARAADAGGIEAGAARDELLAGELAQAVRLAQVERHALTPVGASASTRRAGGDFDAGADTAAAGALDRNAASSRSDAPPAQPPRDLSSATAGPAAQTLIERYLERRYPDRHRGAP